MGENCSIILKKVAVYDMHLASVPYWILLPVYGRKSKILCRRNCFGAHSLAFARYHLPRPQTWKSSLGTRCCFCIFSDLVGFERSRRNHWFWALKRSHGRWYAHFLRNSRVSGSRSAERGVSQLSCWLVVFGDPYVWNDDWTASFLFGSPFGYCRYSSH